MEATKKHSQYFKYIRRLHRILAPIMLLPLFLTTITGIIYEILYLAGKGREKSSKWILDWHKGDFGVINLEIVYPFLTALGLFILLFTGIVMWRTMQRSSIK
ncbi:MAG: hypothetical protein ACK45T_02955 [Pseudanabaena sp.]|jgi:hypothetical protein